MFSIETLHVMEPLHHDFALLQHNATKGCLSRLNHHSCYRHRRQYFRSLRPWHKNLSTNPGSSALPHGSTIDGNLAFNSICSALSPSGNGYHCNLPEIASSHAHLPLSRRHSVLTQLRKSSSSQGWLLDSFGRDGWEKDKDHDDERHGGLAAPIAASAIPWILTCTHD
jgi:hypothetical protein